MAARSLLQLFLVAGMLFAGATTEPSSRQAVRSQGQKKDNSLIKSEWDTISSTALKSDVVRFSNGTELRLFPASDGVSHKHLNSTTRRILGDFRQCSPCTCCDRSRRWCLPTVCCYNIRCGVTGLPFGLCSFVPISCTCFGCRS